MRAPHRLADARGIEDTSRQGRWHNQRFAKVPTELGLEPHKHDRIGWSPRSLPAGTAKECDAHPGFGGQILNEVPVCSTKALREARLTWQCEHHRTAQHLDVETTLIVGTFSYARTGLQTSGDALLANTAAAQDREHRRVVKRSMWSSSETSTRSPETERRWL